VWWDERAPGGRLKGFIYLLHPGPSVLVTATFVAIAGLAQGAVPSASLALRLVLLMLPIQFAIGITNDVADMGADAAMKPYKPLVRGLVGWRTASALAAVLAMAGLATAATLNLPTLALAAGGLGAGLLYDLGLRETPLSWVPWWAGISILPFAAYASVGALAPRLLVLLPLSLLVALSLHCANALPDIASDRAAGRMSLPVLLGVRRSRVVAVAGLAGAGVLALSLFRPLGQSGPWVPASAGLLALILLVVAFARLARPFPIMAVGTAVFAVSWLATLPVR
jgi:4-hydroxybenzoate polyprenyltransferase